MPRAAFETLGCKVNQYETERIAASFSAAGFEIVGPRELADVYVVNTCSVTQVAEAKSRKTIRRLARVNPDAVLVVTGCEVEMSRLLGHSIPEATLLVPNDAKMQVLDRLLEAVPRLQHALEKRAVGRAQIPQNRAPAAQAARPRTRAVVKVQDGCDMSCTFCSVRLTRGPVRSRPVDDVLTEVRQLVAQGRREIVLTGVLIGAYGRDRGDGASDLADLIQAVARTEGVARVRLSSVEPTQVTERLIAIMADEPNVCPHLHMPLQSGDDGVLASMRRPYSAAFYRDVARRAYDCIHDLAITTDVLVGFPGETEDAHRHTLELASEVGFARMHVFRFSARPGTEAAAMPSQVRDEVKDRRASEMMALGAELRRRFAARHLGQTMEVLAEPAERPGWFSGYTGNYIRVRFAARGHQIGELVRVRLTELTDEGVAGVAAD